MDRSFFDLQELIGKRGLINNTFTLIGKQHFVPNGLVSYLASGRNLQQLGCQVNNIEAGSMNFSVKESIEATIGEYIERFQGAKLERKSFLYGSYESLSKEGYNLLEPKSVAIFSDSQYLDPLFPFKRFSPSDYCYWLAGTNYFSNDAIYIPAFLVYWAYSSDKNDNKFLIPTSTGLATGPNLTYAVRSGFLEAVERHSFAYFWYKQKSLKFITYSSDLILKSFSCDRIKTLFQNKRVTIKVFDLSPYCDIECIVVFIFFIYKNREYFTVGSSARFSKKDAIIKACLEAYQGIDFALYLKNKFNWDTDYRTTLPYVNNFEESFHFYNAYPELRKHVPIFAEALKNSASESEIVYLDHRLADIDDPALIANARYQNFCYVNFNDNKTNGYGFNTIKAILPSLALLSPSFKYPYLGALEISESNENAFLELPHCFP